MPIDTAHYHGWQGRLGSSGRGVLALVRVGLLQVFRRKLYWLVLGLGLCQFLAFWSAIYIVTQLQQIRPEGREFIYRAFGFTPEPQPGEEDGYVMFMSRQSAVVMLLLAFSGSLLVDS